jgi:hypothetical protein
MLRCLKLTVCVLAVLVPNAKSTREVVSFDFAWRFHLGEVGLQHAVNCSNPLIFPNKSGVQCWNLHNYSQAATAAACADLCCTNTSGCNMWQFSEKQQAQEGKGCYNGVSWGHCSKNHDWVGGARSATPTPKPAPTPAPAPDGPAQPGYDDSKWQLMDVPHDFIIGGTYDKTNPASGQSYLPRNNGWYRKQ